PLAPDDDPDFLWKLEQQRRREARGEGTGERPTAGPTPGRAADATDGTSDDDAPRKNPSGETDGAPGAPSSGSSDPS
ncbi:hypothetical protein DLJ96_19275, partial [Actinotalea fermentans ATCC 43279 = JCM 9966 = DSM 3133]